MNSGLQIKQYNLLYQLIKKKKVYDIFITYTISIWQNSTPNKTPDKLVLEGNFFNLIHYLYKTP